MATPLLYVTRGGIAQQYVAEFRGWYRKHAASLLVNGFWSARQYTANAADRWSNVYEIGDISVFKSKSYVDAAQTDPFRKTNISRFYDLSVTVYEQAHVLDRRGTAISVYPSIGGPAITFIRFEWDAEDLTLLPAISRGVAQLGDVAVVKSARLCRQYEGHPEFASTDPRYCLALEWGVPIDGPSHETVAAKGPAALTRASRLSVETITKFHGVLCEDYFQ